MDLQLTAIIATLWVATGLTRYVMMRPVARKFRDTMCGLYLDMGLTEEELRNSNYMLGMKLAKCAEFVSDLILAPYYLLRDRASFFRPVHDGQVYSRAVHTFRHTVIAHGEHVEMLEAYEIQLAKEADELDRAATRH